MNPILNSALFLRRRSVWEAVDSGILLWRDNFGYFIFLFALPVWVTAFGLRILPGKYIYLSYLLLWWLKPLFDRLVLHVTSVRFFSSPDPAQTRAVSGGHTRGLWRTIHSGLLGDLLWRRFSPGRGARMPIRILERIGRKQFMLRKKTLGNGGLNFCFLIGCFGLGLEFMLLLGEALFVIMVTQVFFPSAFDYMRDNLETMEIFIFAAYCLNYIIVESLYVCMGFGLYINSRVEVEGWDLQLLFQKFAGVCKILLVCIFLACAFGAPALYADDKSNQYFPEGFPSVSAESFDYLEMILESKDFGGEKKGWAIRFKEQAEPGDLSSVDFAPWMEKIREMIGLVLKIFMIVVIAAFVLFAVFWFWKFRRRGIQKIRRNERGYTNPLMSAESPESLYARAEELFSRGLLREAWAACLAGYLGAYMRYRSISFPVNATEYGCLDLVKTALPGEEGEFSELIQGWILLAYAGRTPADRAFERALAHGRSFLDGVNQ